MTATPATPATKQATKPKLTVKQIIMQKLLAGETISPLTALNDFGCLSLPQRISELRAKASQYRGEW